ncbi:hypothetical protein NUZ5A_30016 [Candidatus Nitrosotenuis uzonensis]|uniref:Uncharacterized protein n=1 Tax=Candidatus Nitrosotenuis uzonensis TaxID=1407055 RepID=A0A812EZ89_9ARCH|nr:hypothetical protein NUZ5A_30016 [Candidatus Nitrosotenuis uzonensis]
MKKLGNKQFLSKWYGITCLCDHSKHTLDYYFHKKITLMYTNASSVDLFKNGRVF